LGTTGGEGEIAHLCEVCASVSNVSGAGITLVTERASLGVGGTDDLTGVLEELQFTLGEGPGVDAYCQNQPVLEPDLAHPLAPRWPAFSSRAVTAGARAVFSFPLSLDTVHLGALNLHRDRSGPLTNEEYADALVLSALAASTVLDMQAHAAPGKLATALDAGANLRLSVHQAAGMAAAQLGVDCAEGLLWVRAYASTNERPISKVAEDVVTRRLRFDDGCEVPGTGQR